jgi:hypothetical protein
MRSLIALVLVALGGCRASSQETVAVANQAGCDVVGGSCGARGQCCDVHDECIDRECPPDMGDVRACDQEARDSGACPPGCAACHDAVTACFIACTLNPDGGVCGPSTCCNGTPADTSDDTCGEEQACYDRSKDPPELITDPCECEQREIDLSASPPRPIGHCCTDTGWGCCRAEGETVPGPGGGGCCEGLVADDGVCVPAPDGGMPDAGAVDAGGSTADASDTDAGTGSGSADAGIGSGSADAGTGSGSADAGTGNGSADAGTGSGSADAG